MTHAHGQAPANTSKDPAEHQLGRPGVEATPAETAISLQQSAGNQAIAALLVQRQDHGHGRARRPSPVQTNFTVAHTTRVIHPHSLAHASVILGLHSQEAGRFSIDPTYDTQVDPNGRVTHVTVTAPVTVELPVWPESSGLPPAALREWERFSAALSAHEDEHVAVARRHYADVGRRMVGQTAERADQIWNTAVSDAQAGQVDLDDRTDHGRNSGTEINLDVDGSSTNVGTPPARGSGGTTPPAHP